MAGKQPLKIAEGIVVRKNTSFLVYTYTEG